MPFDRRSGPLGAVTKYYNGAWQESGQSVRAFCAARGVAEATFFAKRRELAGQDQPQRPAVPTVPSPSFAAVRVIPEPTVEVVLLTGVVVRIPLGADPAVVVRLVAALGGGAC